MSQRLATMLDTELEFMHVRASYEAGLKLHIFELGEIPNSTPLWTTQSPLKPAILSFTPGMRTPSLPALKVLPPWSEWPPPESQVICFDPSVSRNCRPAHTIRTIRLCGILSGSFWNWLMSFPIIQCVCVSCLEYRVEIHLYKLIALIVTYVRLGPLEHIIQIYAK